jgi:hypothetical protein
MGMSPHKLGDASIKPLIQDAEVTPRGQSKGISCAQILEILIGLWLILIVEYTWHLLKPLYLPKSGSQP